MYLFLGDLGDLGDHGVRYINLILLYIMTKKYKTSVELEEDFSYEVRFYCDFCDEEVAEDEQKQHARECEQRQKWNCPHDCIDMKRQTCVDCGEDFYEK